MNVILAFQSVAIFNLLFLLVKDRSALRVDWNVVYKFMGAMSLITLFRLVAMYGGAPRMLQTNPTGLLFVGLEDLAFGGTLYIFEKFISSKKKFLYPVILIISVLFGLGHLAYSISWAIMMCFLPWFVFVKYGKRHGIWTTIVCHTAFDILTFFTFKLAVLLSL
jgi:membrane protease YdiL (CAAX protease family)